MEVDLIGYALKHPEHGTLVAMLLFQSWYLRKTMRDLIKEERHSRKATDRYLWRHIQSALHRLKMSNGLPPPELSLEEQTGPHRIRP